MLPNTISKAAFCRVPMLVPAVAESLAELDNASKKSRINESEVQISHSLADFRPRIPDGWECLRPSANEPCRGKAKVVQMTRS